MIHPGTPLVFCFFVVILISACHGAPDGSVIFEREGCALCHQFMDRGAENGVDLTEVTSRRSDAWIRDQLRTPRKHRPDTGMRSFAHLSGAEIESLIRYLHTGEKSRSKPSIIYE